MRLPNAAIVVAVARPPEETTSEPPLFTVVLVVAPPEETVTLPPLLTVPLTPNRREKSLPSYRRHDQGAAGCATRNRLEGPTYHRGANGGPTVGDCLVPPRSTLPLAMPETF